MKEVNKVIVPSSYTIKQAIKKMDEGGIGFICIVGEDERVIGILSDGDFRRAILNECNLNESIEKIVNTQFKYLSSNEDRSTLNTIFKNTGVKQIPILNDEKKIVEIITENEFYGINPRKRHKKNIDCEVVIMAGGKGTRLDPFTRILPKPLIPIGEKTILEIIIEKFTDYELKNFFPFLLIIKQGL